MCFITAVLILHPKKRPSYSRPAAFPWSRQSKLCGKNNLGVKAFGDHSMRCKSAVFWQTERYYASVSTRTETDGFAGLSGIGRDTVSGNGARFGLIFSQHTDSPIPGVFNGGK
jgi:hypothetical protein